MLSPGSTPDSCNQPFHKCQNCKQNTNAKRKKTMKNKFDELTKSMAQSATRRAALKEFGVCLALAGLLVLPAAAAGPNTGTGTVLDPAGDAVFPFDLYNAPVPPYMDVVEASVTLK